MELGVLHHAQDMELMLDKMHFMVPFFLDIDLLHLIFSSCYNMLQVNNETKNIIKRQNLFSLNLNVQHILAPELDKYFFAKKGSFNNREFIHYKPVLPLLRLYRKLFQKKNFTQPIFYSNDYQEKVLIELQKLTARKDHLIHKYFNVESAISKLKNTKEGTTEKYWHRYTYVIMLAKQFDKFLK